MPGPVNLPRPRSSRSSTSIPGGCDGSSRAPVSAAAATREGRQGALETIERPLGPRLNDNFTVHEEVLAPGDRLVLYSDGVVVVVVEAMDATTGERFGLNRLVDFVARAEAAGEPVPETMRRLGHAVVKHQGDELQDDATQVLLGVARRRAAEPVGIACTSAFEGRRGHSMEASTSLANPPRRLIPQAQADTHHRNRAIGDVASLRWLITHDRDDADDHHNARLESDPIVVDDDARTALQRARTHRGQGRPVRFSVGSWHESRGQSATPSQRTPDGPVR